MRNTKETTETKSTNSTSNKLLKELKALVAEAEKLMSDSTVDPSSEDHINLGERFGAATQKVTEAYNGAKSQTMETAKSTDTFIHDKPYAALAIAVVTGILTGLLIGHHGSSENRPS